LAPANSAGLRNHWVFLKDYLDKYDNKKPLLYTLYIVEKLIGEGIQIPVFLTEPLVNNVEYIRILLKHNKIKECLKLTVALVNHQREIGVTSRYLPMNIIDWLRKDLEPKDAKILDEALATYHDDCLMLQR
jgi:hypothetical protein